MLVYTIDNRSTPPLYESLTEALQNAEQVCVLVKELSLYGFDVLRPLLEMPNVCNGLIIPERNIAYN